MKKTPRLWILLSLAVMLSASAMVGARQALKARPTAVAAIDIEKVLKSLAETQQIEADLNARRERLLVEKRDRDREIATLREDLTVLNAGTEAFRKKQEELSRKAFELQAWANWENQKLATERKLQVALLYNKIVGAVGRIGKEQGYDLVLFREGTLDFSNPEIDDREMRAAMGNRKVLWAADDLDLTDQVMQAMNNEFKNNVRGGPATQPAPR